MKQTIEIYKINKKKTGRLLARIINGKVEKKSTDIHIVIKEEYNRKKMIKAAKKVGNIVREAERQEKEYKLKKFKEEL